MKNDNYGFCHRIEQEVVKVLDQEGKRLFISHLHGLLEKAMPRATSTPAKAIFDYENGVRLPAMALKEIYESLGDVPAYALMCGTLGLSPRDCERLAEMEKSRKRWAKALEWVEKGIALKPTRNWHNEDSSSLACLKPEILRKLGRKQDALASAWADFQEDPNDLSYAELMRYVPRGEKSAWHERAMAGTDKAGLGDFLALCVKAQEWQRFAGESIRRSRPNWRISAITAPSQRPKVWRRKSP
jgi:tetratricopeptide (TPR) repeat protein